MQPITEGEAARIALLTLVAAYLSLAPVTALSGISVDPLSMLRLGGLVGLVVPFMLYVRWRRMKVLPAALGCVAAVLALAAPILVWTYAAMGVNMPLVDNELIAMDSALGFDWHRFVAYVDARPLLAALLALSYTSFPFQLLLLPLLLALAGLPARAYAMVFAYVVVCLAASIVGVWYPALGAYAVHGLSQPDLSSIDVKFGYFFLEEFHAVRDQAQFVLRVDEAAGILTFPSVHAAVAALCAWAAWPAALLRYPVLALNAAMATSAVSHGSHYLVDVAAGFGIAGIAIAVTLPLFYRQIGTRSPVAAALCRAAALRHHQPHPETNPAA